jgi:hypothetical protein
MKESQTAIPACSIGEGAGLPAPGVVRGGSSKGGSLLLR